MLDQILFYNPRFYSEDSSFQQIFLIIHHVPVTGLALVITQTEAAFMELTFYLDKQKIKKKICPW